MATLLIGSRIAFGTIEGPLVFEGFPIGAHLRLCLRPDDFARVFVRVKESGLMQCWFVRIENGIVTPAVLQASNLRMVQGIARHSLPRLRRRLIEDARTPEELRLAKEEMQSLANLPEAGITDSP